MGMVFPELHSSRLGKGNQTLIDASAVFKHLEGSRSEGYDDICISGECLGMAVDFKVWGVIIEVFSKYGLRIF
jgi:hypothetical protein